VFGLCSSSCVPTTLGLTASANIMLLGDDQGSDISFFHCNSCLQYYGFHNVEPVDTNQAGVRQDESAA